MKLWFFQMESTDVSVTDHHVELPLILLGYHQRKHILVIFPAADLIYFTTPICRLINLLLISTILISITLVPIFSSNQEERLLESEDFLALKETSFSSDEITLLGN